MSVPTAILKVLCVAQHESAPGAHRRSASAQLTAEIGGTADLLSAELIYAIDLVLWPNWAMGSSGTCHGWLHHIFYNVFTHPMPHIRPHAG
jgi:hypothetical protein